MIDKFMQDRLWFESRVPLHSLLGKEWKSLKEKMEKEKRLFENSTDKMGYSTSELRRVTFACETFLNEWIPKITAFDNKVESDDISLDALEDHADKQIRHAKLDRMTREDILQMWLHYATGRMADFFPEGTDAFKRVDPEAISDLYTKEDAFNKAAAEWVDMACPWDGSKACHTMLDWLTAGNVLARAND
jgi:hypothetical protein